MFRLILFLTILATFWRKHAQYKPFDLLKVTNMPRRIYTYLAFRENVYIHISRAKV